MLSKMKMFAAAAVIAMAFIGCTKEETSMSIYDLAGRAKIKGFVSYNAKDSLQEDGHIEGFWIPKSDVEILAKISNAAISGNEDNEGYTEFRTRTNKEGYYEFEIPVPEKAIDVILRAEIFEGVRISYDSLVNNKFYCSDKEGIFTCKDTIITIGANEIKSADFRYRFSGGEISSVSSKLTINVLKGIYKSDNPTFIQPMWSSFEVTIKDGANNIEETKSTDENGTVIFDIVRPQEDTVGFTITVKASASTLVSPYFDEELTGTYEQFYYKDYATWNALQTKWDGWYDAWELIEISLRSLEIEWIEKYGEDKNNWDSKEYNILRMKTKKEKWVNSTGKEWNEEWNNIWNSEDFDKLYAKVIKEIWDRSFTEQRVSVYDSYTVSYPNIEDYPEYYNKPKWEMKQPELEDYKLGDDAWSYDWEAYNEALSVYNEARNAYWEEYKLWNVGYNVWREMHKVVEFGDMCANVYMVFKPTNINNYYRSDSKISPMRDEDEGYEEEEKLDEYDYYFEWIDAFVDAKTKINNGAKQ